MNPSEETLINISNISIQSPLVRTFDFQQPLILRAYPRCGWTNWIAWSLWGPKTSWTLCFHCSLVACVQYTYFRADTFNTLLHSYTICDTKLFRTVGPHINIIMHPTQLDQSKKGPGVKPFTISTTTTKAMRLVCGTRGNLKHWGREQILPVGYQGLYGQILSSGVLNK